MKKFHWSIAFALVAFTSCGNPTAQSFDLAYKTNTLPTLTAQDTKQQLTLLFHGTSLAHLEKVRHYYGGTQTRVIKEFTIDASTQCEDFGFAYPFEGSAVKQPSFSKDFIIKSYAKMTQMCSLHLPTLKIDKGDFYRAITVPFSPFDLIPES